MNIFKYLVPLLVAPSLTFAQSSLAQDSKPDLNRRLAMYAKPAVVRFVSRCEGIFYYYKDGVPKYNGKPLELDEIDFDEYPTTNYYEYNLNFIGTGFLINPNGYIVTSSRVTESHDDCKQGIMRNIKNQLEKNRIFKDDNDNKVSEYIKNHGYVKVFFGGKRNELEEREYEGQWEVYLPYSQNNPLTNENDKIFEVKHSGRKSGRALKLNKDVAIVKVSLRNAPTLKLGDSSKVKIQDQIVAVGYPNAADIELGKDVRFTQKSFLEASVQEGRISNPNKELEGEYPVLQVDIRAGDGSAGSPLINKDGKVVGMLAFNDTDKDSVDDNGRAVPIAIPTSTLQEFIRQSGAINEQGDTDRFYLQGLKNLWNKKYKAAAANFVHVRNLFPIHSEVENLIGQIDEIETSRSARPWTDPAYILAFTLLVGGGIVGAVALFLLRQRPQFAGATAAGRERSTNVDSKERSTNTDSTYNTSYKRNGKGKKCYMEMEYKGKFQRIQLVKDEHRLGRDPKWSDLDIPISWEVISRHHAILKKEGDDYRIFDGDRQNPSRNGSWVNDDFRVDTKEGRLLHNGDRLKIGQDKNDQVLITYFNPNQKDDGGNANPKTTMAN